MVIRYNYDFKLLMLNIDSCMTTITYAINKKLTVKKCFV